MVKNLNEIELVKCSCGYSAFRVRGRGQKTGCKKCKKVSQD